MKKNIFSTLSARYNLKVLVSVVALSVASLAIDSQAQADVIRITEVEFVAGAGLITFSEFPLGTFNPTYAPATMAAE